MALSPDFKSRVLASVKQAPAPTRRQALRARLWLFSCGIVGALALFFVKGGVRMTSRPPSFVALTAVGTAVVAGTGMWFLFTRGRSTLRRPRSLLLAAAVLSSIGFVVWRTSIAHVYGLTSPWPTRIGYRCLAMSVGTGGLLLFAALMSWRRSDPVTPWATGAAFGAGAGLGSALLVDLWCPVSYLPHLLLGHVLPIAILAIAGALIGRSILGLRHRSAPGGRKSSARGETL